MIQKYRLISEVDNIEKGSVVMSAEGAINIKAIGIATTTIDNLAKQDAFVSEQVDSYDANTPVPVSVENPSELTNVNVEIPKIDIPVPQTAVAVEEKPMDVQMPVINENVVAQEPTAVNNNLFVSDNQVAPETNLNAPVTNTVQESVQESSPAAGNEIIEPTQFDMPGILSSLEQNVATSNASEGENTNILVNPLLEPTQPEVTPELAPKVENDMFVPLEETVDLTTPNIVKEDTLAEKEASNIKDVNSIKEDLLKLKEMINKEIDTVISELDNNISETIDNNQVESVALEASVPMNEPLTPSIDLPKLDGPVLNGSPMEPPATEIVTQQEELIPTLNTTTPVMDDTPIQSEPGKFIQF